MKKFKKLLMIGMVVVMAMAFTACGGGAESNPVVTPELYAELSDASWGDMTFEEMEEFLGVEGVVDEDSTESWGEGYLVVDFPGPDDSSVLHVLYQDDGTGEMKACSLSVTGQLQSE